MRGTIRSSHHNLERKPDRVTALMELSPDELKNHVEAVLAKPLDREIYLRILDGMATAVTRRQAMPCPCGKPSRLDGDRALCEEHYLADMRERYHRKARTRKAAAKRAAKAKLVWVDLADARDV